MLNTPWMDMQQRPGLTWADRKVGWNTTRVKIPSTFQCDPRGLPGDSDDEQWCNVKCLWDHPAYPFRVFKSHLTPRTAEGEGALPVRERPGVKFVAMVRNGLDVVASRIPFHEAHSPDFRAMWGGFPPQAGPGATARAVHKSPYWPFAACTPSLWVSCV